MDPQISSVLKNKKIMLGITGSIAAYKAAGICSDLIKKGATVFPVMTPNAVNFISPLTLSAISGNRTIVEQYHDSEKIYHISLSHSVDAILIAPATANTIAKLASGICDNFLTTSVISSNCPVLVAPAMNESMLHYKAIGESIEKLKNSGKCYFIGPDTGKLACGEKGEGRLSEETQIISTLERILSNSQELQGKKIIITAGGTREFIDSVRFISNRSSGKMGFAIAEEAHFRGASEVVLISANTHLKIPSGVRHVQVISTLEMKEAILKELSKAAIIVMAAAVSDVIPVKKYAYKLKKNDDIISRLRFKENINILQYLAENKKENQYLVGFSAESSDSVLNAKKKISGRNIDRIILNDISRDNIGFESDFNEVTIIDQKGSVEKIERNNKRIIAKKIWDSIIKDEKINGRN